MVVAFGAGIWMSPAVSGRVFNLRSGLPPFGEAWVILEHQFYGGLSPASVRLRGAVRGLLETLDDPYTKLIDPTLAQKERQLFSGVHGGIGVSLWWTEDEGVGLSPYPGSPASEAGIQEGDQLIAIDGKPVSIMQSLDRIVQSLQGEIGETLTLKIMRDSKYYEFAITLSEVLQPSVQWRVLDIDRGIAYMQITVFTDQTLDEVLNAMTDLQSGTLKHLILDLRGNPGGLISPLPYLTGTFLPEGTPIYYEYKQERETVITAKGEMVFNGMMVVLVDGGTGSAAEIFAAALAENQRAILVGEPTFGKGSIQSIYPLRDGSTLHITNAVWLTPKRHRLDGEGLQPEFTVLAREGHDAALERAIAYLKLQ